MDDIETIHLNACNQKQDSYIDPITKLQVFTEYALSKNGSCCGLGCRHCPYRKRNKNNTNGNMNCDTNNINNSVTSDSCDKNVVYTRTGDNGTSSLFNGERVHKATTVFEALGTVDELSAFVGQAYVECQIVKNGLSTKLKHILSCLLDLGSFVATPRDSELTSNDAKVKTAFEKENVVEIEKWIDAYTKKLPNLTSFILPIGGRAASSLHVCRTVCRRAERCMLGLGLDRYSVDNDGQAAYQYINRLSDFFFIAARWAQHFEGEKELIYVQPASMVNGNSDDNDYRKREIRKLEKCKSNIDDEVDGKEIDSDETLVVKERIKNDINENKSNDKQHESYYINKNYFWLSMVIIIIGMIIMFFA